MTTLAISKLLRDAFGAVPTSSTNPNPNPPPSTDPDPSTFPSATSSHFGPEVALAAAQSGIDSTRHYDWTYSTTWPGVEGTDRPLDLETEPTETSKEESKSRHEAEGRIFKEGNPREDRIPTERLVPGPNAEPILFYDDLVLFEDELADNGSSVLRVKVVSFFLFHPIISLEAFSIAALHSLAFPNLYLSFSDALVPHFLL